MACNCIKDVSERILEHATKQALEKNETIILPIRDWDDEGMRNWAFSMGNRDGVTTISSKKLKTDFVYRSTFKKKDGTDSKPRPYHISLMFTYCPFCGKPYEEPENSETDVQGCDATAAK